MTNNKFSRVLSRVVLAVFFIGLASYFFARSFNKEEELITSAAEVEASTIINKSTFSGDANVKEEVKEVVKEAAANTQAKEGSIKDIINNAPIDSDATEEKTITPEEAIAVIQNAYLSSIYLFNRDVDRSESIDEGIFCRPQDKLLTYDTILSTLRNYYTEGFIEKGNIGDKALKIQDGKVYVLLLEGDYDYNSKFEVVNMSSNEDTVKVRVKLITSHDAIESEVTLMKEKDTWKVESGIIFPQIP